MTLKASAAAMYTPAVDEFDPHAVGVDIKKGDAICDASDRPAMCFKITTMEHQSGTDADGNSRSGHAGARHYGGKDIAAEEKGVVSSLAANRASRPVTIAKQVSNRRQMAGLF